MALSSGGTTVHVVKVKLLAPVLLPPQNGRCRAACGWGKKGKSSVGWEVSSYASVGPIFLLL